MLCWVEFDMLSCYIQNTDYHGSETYRTDNHTIYKVAQWYGIIGANHKYALTLF